MEAISSGMLITIIEPRRSNLSTVKMQYPEMLRNFTPQKHTTYLIIFFLDPSSIVLSFPQSTSMCKILLQY